MRRIRVFAFAAAGLLVAVAAVAQQHDSKDSERKRGGMMEGCREMMKEGGMMDRRTMGRDRPNEQWRKSEPGK